MKNISLFLAIFISVNTFALGISKAIKEIGITIETTPNSTIIITSVEPGSAASKAGLKKNDMITWVKKDAHAETIQIANKPLNEVIELFKGPKGTQVTVGFLRYPEQDDKTATLMR